MGVSIRDLEKADNSVISCYFSGLMCFLYPVSGLTSITDALKCGELWCLVDNYRGWLRWVMLILTMMMWQFYSEIITKNVGIFYG